MRAAASLAMPDARAEPHGAHLIVVGNEKGGAGKSTVAMHLIVALLKMGRRVGAIPAKDREGLTDLLAAPAPDRMPESPSSN